MLVSCAPAPTPPHPQIQWKKEGGGGKLACDFGPIVDGPEEVYGGAHPKPTKL